MPVGPTTVTVHWVLDCCGQLSPTAQSRAATPEVCVLRSRGSLLDELEGKELGLVQVESQLNRSALESAHIGLSLPGHIVVDPIVSEGIGALLVETLDRVTRFGIEDLDPDRAVARANVLVHSGGVDSEYVALKGQRPRSDRALPSDRDKAIQPEDG